MRIKLGIPLTVNEIKEAVNGNCCFSGLISHICTDSREVQGGDLFIALPGEHCNGEDFVKSAIGAGGFALSQTDNAAAIHVLDTQKALLDLTRYYKTRLKALKTTAAVTGSVGKTTTCEFARQIIKNARNIHSTRDNKNNRIGLPLTLLSTKEETEILLLEMGMNHIGEIKELSECASPDVALITNIGSSHIGNLGSREKIAETKLEITEGNKNAKLIVPYGESLLRKSGAKTFSTSDMRADYCLKRCENREHILYKKGTEIGRISFGLKGEHLFACLCAAIAVSAEIGLDIDEIKDGISNISEDNIRQRMYSVGNVHFISDCYNSSYESVKAAINTLKEHTGYSRKSVVLGDILELGEYSDQIHREIGRLISHRDIYNLYLVGENAAIIGEEAKANGFPFEHIFCNSNPDFIQATVDTIKSNVESNELILIKGSRKLRLERIIDIYKSYTMENDQ
jgi:UDP-N-acetylmuramoyl-tripeptide--D-alanyl-D-alanine ligase